jgi:hypothetical protein
MTDKSKHIAALVTRSQNGSRVCVFLYQLNEGMWYLHNMQMVELTALWNRNYLIHIYLFTSI